MMVVISLPEITQLLIVCEMSALSAWALKLYRKPDKFEVKSARDCELAFVGKAEHSGQQQSEIEINA